MWFPRKQRSIFQSLAATISRSWRRTRRENRHPRGRSAGKSNSTDFRGIQLLEPRALLTSDFGDAPVPYPTTLAENGAEHTDTGPQLGAARDNEANGVHSANATADDTTGAPDDEDGVAFGSIQIGALGANATVIVAGAPTGALVDAWIDFNADGNWGNPGEQIAVSVAVVDGVNTITFDVPSDAHDGQTFARFRLSTAGNLGPEGLAVDGEVEDHPVTIIDPATASGTFTAPNIVTTGALAASSVFAADVDGDGDMDMLSAAYLDDEIAWYENDGSQTFTTHSIDTAADGAQNVFAADVDSDGDLDVLSASVLDDTIAWYENNGSQAFTARTITTTADGAYNITAADVDGDGDIDVLSASRFNNTIEWYENNGSQVFSTHVISNAAQLASSVKTADVDGDGDLDVLSASKNDDKIAWYENDGNQSFTERTITTVANGAVSVFAADVDRDGDMDVLSALIFDDTIEWYENNGNQVFTTRTITTAAAGAQSVFAADVDGDGDVDVLSASFIDDAIAWYENDGSQAFTAHNISAVAAAAASVFAADVDGDGDLDVLSASLVDSKIAWYEHIDLDRDFGDAPAPYPTTIAEDGARHNPSGPRLGTDRDSETNGTHSANADADDTTGTPDDEDGVTFGTIQAGALGATLTVNVQGGAAKLDAWIDFNGDGTWGGPGEQIAASVAVVNGNNTITFDVPGDAEDGLTFARFRLSTAGNYGPVGIAADGEVEDYAVTVIPPVAASGVFRGPATVSFTANGATSVFGADVDGDGDMDMLSSSLLDDTIAWYENDGSQNFTAHTISTAANGARSVSAVDVDGDGDMDVLSASQSDHKIAWYENDGSQNFTPHTITLSASQARDVLAADVDGDGDLDFVSASYFDDKIAWYENDGSQNFTPHTITTNAVGAVSVFAADVDGDGDMDVLSASMLDDKIAWYENDGSQNFTAHTISATAISARSVTAADVDGDGDMDVLSASANDNELAWYENDGNQNFTAHTVSASAFFPLWVIAADLDGDGDVDVITASGTGQKVEWYENDGNQNFTIHALNILLSDNTWSVFAADVDGDGDLDILGASFIDDEINWWEQVGSDFGDAPTPYPTTVAENGAKHAKIGPTLGTNRDSELTGVHSASADADDTTGIPDDEDGVTFGTIRAGALATTVAVNVAGITTTGRLDAWIDFNGDGSWGGPGEQIAASVTVVNGNNTITFDVPSDAKDGTTYARFRLSTAGSLGPEGAAPDGEVEDYAVTIRQPIAASGVFGGQNTVTTGANFAQAVFAADVDGDGDMDMLSASSYDDKIAWYENDGNQFFTPHTISTTANGAHSVTAADVDGDGDMDVLSASFSDDKIAWYENDGSQTFTARTISTTADGAQNVFAADVDGDGDLDVLSTSLIDDTIAWYENDGSQNFTARTISTTADGALSLTTADVDGDGDLDVLSATYNDSRIAWYENDGNQTFTVHTISASAPLASSVTASDVDGDGDMDVLSASFVDDRIAWYENDGNQTFTVHTVSVSANGAEDVLAADVDGDGDVDVVSASRYDDRIAWYENDGSQNFTARTISTAANGAYSAFVADVDGDGDLDILSASQYDDRIAWYENLGSDFGDAPVPYPTNESENGARHDPTGPTLGANRDTDVTNGAHSANADADDLAGVPDDEDGVTFSTIQAGVLGATLSVTVAGAPSGALLDAWIDFNGDGNWGGPGEQIAANVAVVNGANTITFDVPGDAKDGTSFARFRLSTAGSLGVIGAADDGEVEDYAVTITPPGISNGIFGAQNTVTTTADAAQSVVAADMDGDGDMDMLSASYNNDRIAWYENNGSQVFTVRTISLTANGAQSVFAADVDGDGDMDVLSASRLDNKIAWYENNGSQIFTVRTISITASDAQSVFAADMDGDGDIDVLSASANDDKIAWYENNGSQIFSVHTISTTADGARDVFAADVDRDGDVDVLSASGNDDRITWYENDGLQNFTAMTISATSDGAQSVFAADVDGDGDFDVLSASTLDNTIAWFENDGSETFTAQTISSAANGASSVYAADVNGDGDMDVLSASSFDDRIVWYENDGSEIFTTRTISSAADNARSVTAADVDGDGDLDVLSASNLDDRIAWYGNIVAPVLTVTAGITYTEGDPATAINTGITVADADSLTLATAVVTITNVVIAEDVLSFTNDGATMGNISVSTNVGGVLTLQSVGATATVVEWQSALRAVSYSNSNVTNPNTTQRLVSFVINDGALNSNTLVGTTITITRVNDAPVLTPAGFTVTVSEDAGLPGGTVGSFVSAFTGNIADVDISAVKGIAIVATDETNGTWHYSTDNGVVWTPVGTVNSASSLLLADNASTRLYFAPAANYYGTSASALTLRGWDQTGGAAGTKVSTAATGGTTGFSSATDTVSVVVNPVADTPSVTNATTNEDVQTTSGLVISRHAADGAEVTHFKITNIVNGTLFQNDGTTPINAGDFITFAQANAGLKFTPTASFSGTGTFDIQASISNADAGLGGSFVTATITINAVSDTPGVTGATTNEDVQTTSGLVISRNAADGAEVTHFKITSILNGTLFQNNGTTPIAAGSFITFAQANAGLKFTPSANLFSPGTPFSFAVQGSTSNTNAGLGGGVVTATITVNTVADTPAVSNAVTNNDIQTSSGLVISRNAVDSAEVTHFKITTILNGTLFQNDGITPIVAGSFITFAQGNAGLKFTPTPTFVGMGHFSVQASISNLNAGLGGSVVTATITVNDGPATPSVTSTTTSEDVQSASGLVISRNAADGPEVTHFKITRIMNGSLFQNDGTTPISSGSFITFAQANAGLKFTPAANLFSPGTTFSFDVQASLSNANSGLGGGVLTASITVNPVADTPSVTSTTTREDVQSTSGLVISRNAADGSEVTHIKITSIVNGTLFWSDGNTPVLPGDFIPYAQANAGLKFTPAANYFGIGSFNAQASKSNTNAGLGGGIATATITISAAADSPGVTVATTSEDVQTTNGLVISRNVLDGSEVTHFKISTIVNGTLFQNNGITPISAGSFITFAQANAGLKFTPTANIFGTGTFGVQASTSSSNAGLGGSVVTASITIIPVADTPSVTGTTTKVNVQTTSGLVISANAVDSQSVTHFRITSIVNGTLFRNDGITPIGSGDFITRAQGNAGLKFTPAANYFGTGSFAVQASTSGIMAGLSGSVVTATITIEAVPRTPSVTNAATLANKQTTSGLVISRNPADGAEVTHFMITNIVNGTLFRNNGVTKINIGDFITFAQGNAGLKFTPNLNTLATGQFSVQASVNSTVTGLGGSTVTASITVTLPAPTITGPSAVTPLQRPTITWTPVSGADRYEIWINNRSTGVSPYLKTTQTSTAFTPGSDLGIGKYSLWIRSGNSAGQFSVYTPEYKFLINTAATLSGVQRYQTTATPTVAWNPLAGATKYDLWIDNLSTGQQQFVRDVNLTGTSWTAPTNLPMGDYRAWVRGLDASGLAAKWSPAVDFFVLPTVSVIGPVNATFDITPTFSWNAVLGAVGYDLVLRNLTTGVVVSSPKNILGTSYTQPTSLTDGMYRWYVVAVSSTGYRSQSATSQDFFVGGRPTLLAPVGSTTDTTPTFNWTPVHQAATFDLYVSRTDVPTGGIINLTGLTGTSYTPATLLPKGTYRAWVRAVSTTAALSPWSIQVDFRIAAVTDESGSSPESLLNSELTGLRAKAVPTRRTRLSTSAADTVAQSQESASSAKVLAGMAFESTSSTPAAPRDSRQAGKLQSVPAPQLFPADADDPAVQAVMADLSSSGFLLDI